MRAILILTLLFFSRGYSAWLPNPSNEYANQASTGISRFPDLSDADGYFFSQAFLINDIPRLYALQGLLEAFMFAYNFNSQWRLNVTPFGGISVRNRRADLPLSFSVCKLSTDRQITVVAATNATDNFVHGQNRPQTSYNSTMVRTLATNTDPGNYYTYVHCEGNDNYDVGAVWRNPMARIQASSFRAFGQNSGNWFNTNANPDFFLDDGLSDSTLPRVAITDRIGAPAHAAAVWIQDNEVYSSQFATGTTMLSRGPEVISSGGTVTFADIAIVRSTGEAVAVWRIDNGSGFGIEYATVDLSGGASAWSVPASITTSGPVVGYPKVIMDSAGNATAAWKYTTAGVTGVEVATLVNGAGSWTDITAISPTGTESVISGVELVASSAGDIMVAWHDTDSSGDNRVVTAYKEFGQQPVG